MKQLLCLHCKQSKHIVRIVKRGSLERDPGIQLREPATDRMINGQLSEVKVRTKQVLNL